MKNILILSSILILSACAKERTTQYFSTQGQTGEPISFVLTNSDYKEQEIKPFVRAVNADFIEEAADQENLATLYTSFEATEAEFSPPADIVCEIIPQKRIQKTLGRLACLKMTSEKRAPFYSCAIDLSKTSDEASKDDQLLYEALSLPEVDETNGRVGAVSLAKRIGSFYCTKITGVYPGALPQYQCGKEKVLVD